MRNKILFFLILSGISLAVRSQVAITGPSCVLPGIQYQYLVSTTDTSGTGSHICLSGGVFAGSADSCITDSLVSAVYVIWNAGITTGTINISSVAGSTSNTINITSVLRGGFIDSGYIEQTINYDSTISFLTCSAATGGSCSPSYSYQWLQSADNLIWNEISGATNQNFDVSVTLIQTAYFKRKVTETSSGSIGYSPSATVHVNLPANQNNNSSFNDIQVTNTDQP